MTGALTLTPPARAHQEIIRLHGEVIHHAVGPHRQALADEIEPEARADIGLDIEQVEVLALELLLSEAVHIGLDHERQRPVIDVRVIGDLAAIGAEEGPVGALLAQTGDREVEADQPRQSGRRAEIRVALVAHARGDRGAPLPIGRAALGARQEVLGALAILRRQRRVLDHPPQIGARLLIRAEAVIENADLGADARQIGIEDQQPLERRQRALDVAGLDRDLREGQRLVAAARVGLHGGEGCAVLGCAGLRRESDPRGHQQDSHREANPPPVAP